MSRTDSLHPVYGISGEDRPKVERALARLVRRIADGGGDVPERIDAGETPVTEIVAACQSLSFGGTKAVVVEGADAFRAADADHIVAYLEDPNPQTVLVLVSLGAVPQRLGQAIDREGQRLHWGPPPKARARERRAWLEEYVAGELQRHGVETQRGVGRRVVERTVHDINDAASLSAAAIALGTEAEKLATFAAGQVVDVEAVDAVVPAHPGARVYELADAIAQGRPGQAFALLHDLSHGGDRVAPQVIQSGLLRHFQAIAAVQELGDGASGEEVTGATGLRGYPAQKAAEQAQQLPRGSGHAAMIRLARLELDLRVGPEARLGTGPDDGLRFTLERAVSDVLAAVRRN